MRPPNDLPPAISGSFGNLARGFGDGGAHRGVRELWRIGPLAAFLHVEELVAQGRDAARREFRRDRRHEGVIHAGAGAVRQHVTGARVPRRLQQARDAGLVVDRDGDGLGVAGRHGFLLAGRSRRVGK